MLLRNILQRCRWVAQRALREVDTARSRWTKAGSQSSPWGTMGDRARRKPQLITEQLLLRQQLSVLNRSVKRSPFIRADRARFVLLARWLPGWREALRIVKPATILRWHREGFRLFWKRTSRATSREPKIPHATITLIKEMAANNRFTRRVPGAERIRGELQNVGIQVAKHTVQRYMQHARPPRAHGQTWATFLRNHASDSWACDFLQVTDMFFLSWLHRSSVGIRSS